MRPVFLVFLVTLALLAVTVMAAPPVEPDAIFWFVRYGQSLSVGSVGYCGSTGYPACSSGAAYGSLTLFAPNSTYPPCVLAAPLNVTA